MAEIKFNTLYDQLSDLEKQQYEGVMGMGGFKERYEKNPTSRLVTGDANYEKFKKIADAQAQIPESSILDKLNPFSSASAAEVDLSNRGMPVANDGSIMVEDLTGNTNTGNFLISAANALPNQSGIINALPNIMNTGVKTREGALIPGDRQMNFADARRAMTQPGLTDQATVYDPMGIRLEDGSFSYDMNKTSLDDFRPSYENYEDLIMNPDYMPNRLQNLERFADNRFLDDEEEIPGFNFIDAPTSLASRLKNLEYINNPRTGLIDKTLLARGNPNAGLINRSKDGILSVLSRIPTPFNLVRRGLDAITGPRRETTGIVYDDRGRGYTPEELNKMNAKGGYYSQPAIEQRRREKRVEKMLERKAAGKSYSQKNLNKLTTGGSKPGTYTTKGAGSAGESRSKIVCTMMNERYGFGSFRNKIWMKFHENHGPEYQKGYHAIFLPLVKIAKGEGKINTAVRKVLEHMGRHVTADMFKIMKGKKRDPLGRIYRAIFEPTCRIIGKIKSALGRG